MSKYLYETEDFGLSETGIHLLRSRFNYQTIPYGDVKNVRIEKTKIINNWLLIFMLGAGLVMFSVYYTTVLFDVFTDDTVHRIYIEEILIPFLPLVAGIFMMVASLRTGIVLRVQYGNSKSKRLPLQLLQKGGVLQAFVQHLEIELKRKGKLVQVAAAV